jgi:DNA-binding CsgD family transcriptional regulator
MIRVVMGRRSTAAGLSAIAEIWYSLFMGSQARALEKLEAVARSGSDLVTLWREAGPLLRQAVPHFESPCFFTVDPASLLTTSHFQEGLPEIPGEWLGREYAEGDYNSMTEVLHSARGAGTLHDATGGRPELSRKFHEEMQPFGCDQELLVALRTRDGERWGVVGLYREVGRPDFSSQEIESVSRVAPALAAGARHGLLLGQAQEPDLPDAPGLLVLDETLVVESATPASAGWLADLGGTVESPPASVLAVAGQVLSSDPGPAESRVRSGSGRWVVLRGAPLIRHDRWRQVSVLIEPAQPAHLASLLMRVHGLTPREQQIAGLVFRGRSTDAIARELSIAPGTVQAHLRSIFDKTGVRSRRELVGAVFHQHYEPRVRDNERRTATERPARDGPMT